MNDYQVRATWEQGRIDEYVWKIRSDVPRDTTYFVLLHDMSELKSLWIRDVIP